MITLIKKYDDKTLTNQAERALSNEPGIDHSTIDVTSKKGIVTLTGKVRNAGEHQRALNVVRRSFEKKNLTYVRIEDKLAEN